MTITGSGLGSKAIKTFDLLDQFIEVLGATKPTLFPFLETVGGGTAGFNSIESYKGATHFVQAVDEVPNAITLESEFSPYIHAGGVGSYSLDAGGSQYLQGEDSTDYEFAANADFSVGAFILPTDITSVTVLAKYDVLVQREWKFGLQSASKIELESFDETNNHSRIGAGDTAVTINQWSFICATTDGADLDASQSFYLNGVADGSGNTASDAAYASQPGTNAKLAIGAAHNTTPALTELFSGRIALPFVTGKELSAADVATIYNIGRILLGLA